MNQKEAYSKGRDNGYDAVLPYYGPSELPHTPSAANKADWKMDEVREEAWESEQGARQYAEFSYFASEMNRERPEWRMEALWDKYEEGVGVGIRRGLRERGYDV